MTAAFHTLGCKTNAYETQAVIEQFQSAGFQIGSFSEPSDVYVINTCSVTQEAARKSRQMIGRCRRQNPHAVVVVTGCYAQEKGGQILSDSGADLVIGNGEKSRILPAVTDLLQSRGSVQPLQIRDLSLKAQFERQQITGQEGHVRAYVKIQDGCDRFCSYCLIPFLRGRSCSRSAEDILREAQALAEKGYHEIVLTGIDISSYRSEECPDRDPERSGEQLAELIRSLHEIPGIRRIRLGSLEAGVASGSLIRSLHEIPSFCPQFHLSLQSGCDTVLKRMNRHYTTEEYADTVKLIREYFPDAGITTDIITGFPGETGEEFQKTVDFARRIGFSRIHVFPYSRRPGTRADRMPEQLTRKVKEERAAVLIREGEILRQQYEERLIGQTCEILTEEYIQLQGCTYAAGYTPEYVRILTPAQPDPEGINRFVKVAVKSFLQGHLFAEGM